MKSRVGDRLWSILLAFFGSMVFVIAGLILVVLWKLAHPAFAERSVREFLFGQDWDPVMESFGALPFIYGTLVTSALAVLIALPVSVGLAIFLIEMAPRRVRPFVTFAVEMLASIPSVIYGLWALFILVPLLRDHVEPFLGKTLGFLPLFQGPPLGLGYLAAGVVLAIMILPTIASMCVEVLRANPPTLREGALALGATRWQAIWTVILPYSRVGIFGGTLLGLGRALGETMAVTMVIGNQPEIHASLFAPGYTLPSVIANEFAEATGDAHLAVLAALGLVLFGLTLLLNAAARLLMRSTTTKLRRV